MAWILIKDKEPRDVRQSTREAAQRKIDEEWLPISPGDWTVAEVPDDRWGELEARHLHRNAVRYVNDHGHNSSDRDPLTRENCAACLLNGYAPRGYDKTQGPNVAAWARDLVCARMIIPEYWHKAFLAEIDCNDNAAYTRCLLLDITTFGVYGIEHAHVQRAVNRSRRLLAGESG
jgi:hypothetical protein